jgi:purine-binding chemotaxis protein CheW
MNAHSLSAAEELEESRAGSEEQQQYLTFRVGEETFAIGILAIKEIIEYASLTAVPMMPDCVRGVINLRGRVVPVIDLAVRFGKDATVPGRRTCIVIVEVDSDGEHQDIGIVVDAVNQVLEIPDEEIEPAPGFGTKLRPDFIAGMGKVDGEFVIILSVNQVLSIEDLSMIKRLDQ